jgi:predicted AlkP superfamily pyrophosphatase or phosphodiesterase
MGQDTTQHFVEGRRNAPAQMKKPYVILISADGFRYDYIDKYPSENLLRLSASGVRASSMIPSFPSVTFPNHYTIVTGLYPSHHGIVYNQFYDRKRMASYAMGDRKAVEDGSWYGGTPLWVLAEQQQMMSASYHFVGTEAAIRGLYPSYWYRYSDGIDLDLRIATVVNWLKLPEETRPHFITFYMSDVDHAGHSYGPDAMETRKAVELVDQTVGKLEKEISRLGLPVNFVFVSDHGMAAVDTVYRMDPVVHVDTAHFIVKGGGTTIHLYAKSGADVTKQTAKLKKEAGEYDVYTRDQLPAHWHYSEKDDRFGRMGDIILIPRYPKVFSTANRRIIPGAHGFDTKISDMHATFLAWGPAFKKGLRIPSFENVHVYPMLCALLGLKFESEIDGKAEVLRPILKNR